jgi:hypothetical protein
MVAVVGGWEGGWAGAVKAVAGWVGPVRVVAGLAGAGKVEGGVEVGWVGAVMEAVGWAEAALWVVPWPTRKCESRPLRLPPS